MKEKRFSEKTTYEEAVISVVMFASADVISTSDSENQPGEWDWQ